MSVLAADALGVDFGGVRAVESVSLDIASEGVTAVIGPNGAGKTTLFNLLSGIIAPTRGRVRLGGQDVTGARPDRLAARGLARTFQNLQIFHRMTALENVMVGAHLSEPRRLLGHLLPTPSRFRQDAAAAGLALAQLDRVGLADVAQRAADSLPYGGLKRLEIARALAGRPQVLLLDEPAAGCNPQETETLSALIRALADDGLSVVLVEHDMAMVMGLAERVVVMDRGAVIADGPPAAVQADEAVRAAYLGPEFGA